MRDDRTPLTSKAITAPVHQHFCGLYKAKPKRKAWHVRLSARCYSRVCAGWKTAKRFTPIAIQATSRSRHVCCWPESPSIRLTRMERFQLPCCKRIYSFEDTCGRHASRGCCRIWCAQVKRGQRRKELIAAAQLFQSLPHGVFSSLLFSSQLARCFLLWLKAFQRSPVQLDPNKRLKSLQLMTTSAAVDVYFAPCRTMRHWPLCRS